MAAAVLPVTYRDAWPDLLSAIRRHAPDLVVATGLAPGRSGLSIERLAINLDDAEREDEMGEIRRDRPVVAGGPIGYFATLPVKRIVAALAASSVPAELSDNAGRFLCNHVLYRLCHHAATEQPGLRCGFIHLPHLPAQAARHGTPGMELAVMVTGLRVALDACAEAASRSV